VFKRSLFLLLLTFEAALGQSAHPQFDRLSKLRDVSISNPQDTQVLTYDLALGKWKNANSGGGGGGGTWGSITGTLSDQTDLQSALNAKQNSFVADSPLSLSAGHLSISAIPNATLANSAITIAGTSVSLGGSISLDTIDGISSNGLVKRTAANARVTITDNSSNWDNAFTERRQWDGGATNLVAATGRTSLGLVIGTNVEAWDADLDTWATLTPSANFQTMVPHTFAQMRTDLGLVIGTNVEAWDTQLDSLAGLAYTGNALKVVRVNAGETAFELATAGGGSGTVTTFSSGNLSPLFTTSVSNPTTTPALSFSLSTVGAHAFLGNNTGSVAAPAYVQPDFTDLSGTATDAQVPNILTLTKISGLGNGILQITGGDGTLSPISYFTDTGFHHLIYSASDTGSIDFEVENTSNGTGSSAGIILKADFSSGTIGSISKYSSGLSGSNFAPSDLGIQPGSIGRLALFGNNQTLTASASLKYDNLVILPTTLTLAGTTAVTTATGLNKVTINNPTYTDPSAVTVTRGATLYIEDAPAVAGSLTLTNPYALWIDGGIARFDGGLKFTEAAPASGKFAQSNGTIYSDSSYSVPASAGAAGYTWTSNGTSVASYPKLVVNSSTSTVSAGFATDTYLAGSAVTVAAGDFKAGGQYRCQFDMVKTAAGTAAATVIVRTGTNGTTADGARLTMTWGAGTAAADTGQYTVTVTWRTVGAGTSATVQGVCRLDHILGGPISSTGLTNTVGSNAFIISGASAGFDSSAQTKMGVSFNGGTSFSGTCTNVQAELRQP
jgi:hypothetical protein